jgi:Ca2+-binding RTX toxin-like protein
VRDLQRGTTSLDSVNKGGTGSGNSYSVFPRISANGRFVVFTSRANDLVDATDTNEIEDVFVRDLQSGITILVSANEDGTDTGLETYPNDGVISADGRVVAFESWGDDLMAIDNNGSPDVFAFELFEAPEGCDCADPAAIKGTSGPDFLYGTKEADIICGLGDRDFIASKGGDDCIDGGDGNDWILGGRGDDMIFGRAGNDVVYGYRGDDEIYGNEGEDYLFGDGGDDKLDGGKGYDWVFCGSGTDVGIGEHTRGCEN